MPQNKRAQAQIERLLISTLTDACEIAKSEIPGFSWLTHTVDDANFPASLMITWVFDSQADKDRALASGQEQRMFDLTARALTEADIALSPVSAHVRFDSEEQCQRSHAGNWQQRLARSRSARG